MSVLDPEYTFQKDAETSSILGTFLGGILDIGKEYVSAEARAKYGSAQQTPVVVTAQGVSPAGVPTGDSAGMSYAYQSKNNETLMNMLMIGGVLLAGIVAFRALN